jgi:SlyX protein
MSDEAEMAARIDRLETRLTYQELALEDLSAALARQWQAIDRLTRQVTHLVDRVQTLADEPAGSAVPEPPPPHY